MAPPRALALLAAYAAAAATPTTTSSRVDASLGWRFSLGAPPRSCTLNASLYPPAGLNGRQVFGLSSAPAGAPSASACFAAACTAGAPLFQWCPGGAACGAQSCWVGAYPGTSAAQAGWVSGLFAGGNATALGDALAAAPPAWAAPGFNDSAWPLVDLPHDFGFAAGPPAPGNDAGEGFLPYASGAYRKRLRLPPSWAPGALRIELHVEGALLESRWFLNGGPLAGGAVFRSGYTPIRLRLDAGSGDNATDSAGPPPAPGRLDWRPGAVNVLAAYVDGSGPHSGWWYEGAGLYRRVWLEAAPAVGGVAPNGVRGANYTVDAASVAAAAPGDPSAGATGAVTLRPSAALLNDGLAPSAVTVSWDLVDAPPGGGGGGAVVATTTAVGGPLVVPPGGATAWAAPVTAPALQLWSLARPYLYTLVTTVRNANSSNARIDTVNVTLGFRSADWSASAPGGLRLNGEPVKLRGYCLHENFGGVGAALFDRIDLLRLQQLRGTGGNALRTAHNAPEPGLLDLADALGVGVVDENRIMATAATCVGCSSVPTYAGDPAADMRALVERDRNHASVLLWSFCNEAGCGNGSAATALALREATYAADGTRAVTGNMGWISPTSPSPMSLTALDVMGFSHVGAGTVASYRAAVPSQPLAMTECCSCETQRGEDADVPRNASTSSVWYSSEASGCLSGQTQASAAIATFIWTLTDYYGEGHSWPHVVSSYGSWDVGGLPKAASQWLRAWWLSAVAPSDAGRPPLPDAPATTVYLVEPWAPLPGGGVNATRTLHAYTNAPYVALSVNGVRVGAPLPVPAYGAATWAGVPWAPGNATVTALAAPAGPVLGSHSRTSWGPPAAVLLSLDAPHPSTGTGRGALYADGADVALVRATIVDAAGVPCADASATLTFAVVSGPGVVVGTSNGDPSCTVPGGSRALPAYHGLARAVVRAAVVAAGDLDALGWVNAEAGGGNATAVVLPPGAPPPPPITITVTSPGLAPGQLSVPVSADPADAPLAAAAASVRVADPGVDGAPAVYPPPTPSGSPRATTSPSPTGSLSPGASPSATPSPTASPPGTPSPGAPAGGLLLSVSVPGACLNAVELMVFDVSGRNLARAAASLTASTTYGTQGVAALANGAADYTSTSDVYSSACAAGGDNVTLVFASPAVVATVYFVNRLNGCGSGSSACNYRIVNGGGALRLLPPASPTGSGVALGAPPLAAWPLTSAAPVTALQYAPPNAPAYPAPAGGAGLARYVRITAPPGAGLALREVMVFTSTTHVNVALGRRAWGLLPPGAAGTFAFAAAAVDGALDVDGGSSGPGVASSGGVVASSSSPSGGDVAWVVDLGGGPGRGYAAGSLYVTVWNVWSSTDASVGAALAGALVAALDDANATLTVASLTGAAVQTVALAPPSASASGTGTASGTPSTTPPATPTASVTPSRSASPPLTVSPSSTSPPTLTGSATGTATPPATRSGTASTSATGSSTRSGTASTSGSPSGSRSASGTATASGTGTPSPPGSGTSSGTGTPSASATGTRSASASGTGSGSGTPSRSAPPSTSAAATATGTGTDSRSRSRTGSGSATRSPTPPPTPTTSGSRTGSKSGLPSASASRSAPRSPSPSAPRTGSRTRSRSASRTRSRSGSRSRKVKR